MRVGLTTQLLAQNVSYLEVSYRAVVSYGRGLTN